MSESQAGEQVSNLNGVRFISWMFVFVFHTRNSTTYIRVVLDDPGPWPDSYLVEA